MSCFCTLWNSFTSTKIYLHTSLSFHRKTIIFFSCSRFSLLSVYTLSCISSDFFRIDPWSFFSLHVKDFMWPSAFNSFGYSPRSGIAESYGNWFVFHHYIFIFFKKIITLILLKHYTIQLVYGMSYYYKISKLTYSTNIYSFPEKNGPLTIH